MEDAAVVDNIFSSGQLWKQSTLFDDPDAYESNLFTPLQLDSKTVACLRLERVARTDS
jgi:hypothetical protein